MQQKYHQKLSHDTKNNETKLKEMNRSTLIVLIMY